MEENTTGSAPVDDEQEEPREAPETAETDEGSSARPNFEERLASLRSRKAKPEAAEAEAEPDDEVVVEGTIDPPEESPEADAATEAASIPDLTYDEWSGRGEHPLRQLLSSGVWIYALIAVLAIAALILPPIQLLNRLGLVGYERLSEESPALTHPDGLTVSIDPAGESNPRLRLESIPMVEFLAGQGDAEAQTALQAIPGWLEVKSPYYLIDVASRDRGPATIEVVIPNEAEPWETLDLYTWDGEGWRWIGGMLDAQREAVSARVDSLPSSVVVMQAGPVFPAIGTITTADVDEPTAAVLTEILLPGLFLGTDGMLLGDVPVLGEGSPERVLLVRNWQEQEPNLVLLADLLGSESIQENHIQEIVARAVEENATAIALDYQGVAAEQIAAFTAFVSALGDALHAQGIWLEVLVAAPVEGAAGMDSAGYDWAALGAIADALVFPLPDDPASYSEGSQVERILQWATGQVSRYKLRAMMHSFSTNSGPSGLEYLGLEDALAPFGEVSSPAETTVEPGQTVQFTLVGQVTSIMPDENAGTYAIAYLNDGGESGTVWLGTPSFLARKLDWVFRYLLGGVVVSELTSEDNMPGMLEAVDGYRSAAEMAQPTELEVRWAVTGPDSAVSEEVVSLSQPDFQWVAPDSPGDYTISAAIAEVSRGSVQLTVAEPTPEVVEVESLTPEEAACLQASFVADVTVPDGTQFDKGEEFVKTWRLRNSGTCDWPEGTSLALAFSTMGGPETTAVGAVAAGEEVDISITLTAPQEDGNYNGQWNLKVGDAEILGGIVTVVIVSGEGSAAASAPPPAAPVASGSFELGGHVLNSTLPYASQMHYAGMNWAKVQIRYAGGASDWIQAAHANNFKIQLSALGSPDMVIQAGFVESYANWVAGLAAAGADAIEIWNEPNIDREWQIGHISPQAYTQLLCASYNAIKAANPGTAVISAAPAPTGWFGGCGPNGCDDVPFLQGMFNSGAAACMDYIGAHHNAGATSPSARGGHPADPGSTHHSWFFLPQTETYFNIFGGSRQLFYTEMGYVTPEGTCSSGLPSNFSWGSGTTLAQQGAWLAEAVQLSINTGMVRNVIVWNVDFNRNDCSDCNPAVRDCDPQASYAIVRPGGACPTCDTLHAILGTR